MLDFTGQSLDELFFGGIWQIKKNPFSKVSTSNKTLKARIIWCDERPGIQGIRITKSDIRELKKLIQEQGKDIGANKVDFEMPLLELWEKSKRHQVTS